VVQTPGFVWLFSGASPIGSVDVTVSDAPGYVTGWIDWNRDNDFDDSGEQIFVNEAFATDGTHTVTFAIPDGVVSGTFNARFRVYPTMQAILAHPTALNATLSPVGGATGGEVEDYAWSFSPTAVTLRELRAVGLPTAGLVLAALGVLFVGLLLRRRRHAVG
jgi:hypothetical protein